MKFLFIFASEDEIVAKDLEELDADLEKILNERTSALTKKPTAKARAKEKEEKEEEKENEEDDEVSEAESEEQGQKQRRKKKSVFKKPGFHNVFDSYLLKILEKELLSTEPNETEIYCSNHRENPARECFECSLINLISH